MSDHDPIDDRLRSLAQESVAANEGRVDVEAELDAVLRRAANEPDDTDVEVVAVPSRSARWIGVGAAAAIIGLIAGGLVIGRGPADIVRTDTMPPTVSTISLTEPPATTGPSTTLETPTTFPTPTTAAPAAVVPSPAGGALAIGVSCVSEFNCTQLETLNDGGIVAFDPATNSFTLLDPTGETIRDVVPADDPLSLWEARLETVGPDDVAYFSYFPPDTAERNDVVAIALKGPAAGSTVTTWPGAGSYSGDSDLVPSRTGLAWAGCCGPEGRRPTIDDGLIGWVDSNGDPTTLDGPYFEATFYDTGNELIRIEDDGTRAWVRPAVTSGMRGMPILAATDDGGAIAIVQGGGGTIEPYLIRFGPDWPEYGIDNASVYLLPDFDLFSSSTLIEPAGTLIVRDGDRFVRKTLAEVGTSGWPGQLVKEISAESWTATAPGLNEYIDDVQPAWARDPVVLSRQLVQRVGPAEWVDARWDEATSVLAITTSNFLDDSVFASRVDVVLTRGEDGLYRFERATHAQQCQPGRGQQDFRAELCI